MKNASPWLAQLERTRDVISITENAQADVVIVGAGIAGIMTAYYTLRDTDKRVILVEADKVAHGATGHNAGQITSYFERPLSSLVEEYGLDMAARGQEAVESAWVLLDQIRNEARLATSVHRFTGHAGVRSLSQLVGHLENNYYRQQSGRLDLESILVAEEAPYLKDIPPKYVHLYATVPQEDILSLLETSNDAYTAIVSYDKGCTNSALVCEELAEYMLKTYADRFSLYEDSPISSVALTGTSATVTVLSHEVSARHVVLCTNGFENFSILQGNNEHIDSRFHQMVRGTVGYMAGYTEARDRDPIAISYLPEVEGTPYYYLTRRPHAAEGDASHNLVCVGGPEKPFPEGAKYSRDDTYGDNIRQEVDVFLRANYLHPPAHETHYAFFWHGLMGYTKSGVRLVGKDPEHESLLYNLGCNGVGILPSIYGGKRISEILSGKQLAPSIFDPAVQG